MWYVMQKMLTQSVVRLPVHDQIKNRRQFVRNKNKIKNINGTRAKAADTVQ